MSSLPLCPISIEQTASLHISFLKLHLVSDSLFELPLQGSIKMLHPLAAHWMHFPFFRHASCIFKCNPFCCVNISNAVNHTPSSPGADTGTRNAKTRSPTTAGMHALESENPALFGLPLLTGRPHL